VAMLLLDLLGVPRLKLFVAPIVLRNSCPIAKSQNQEKKLHALDQTK
jgi:hypothetical protein